MMNGYGIEDDPNALFHEPLAEFQISFHLERVSNLPVYCESHQMIDLEEGFALGKGHRLSGSWQEIDWQNSVVFVKITLLGGKKHQTALCMVRYTAKGLDITKVFNSIPDFSLNLFARP